MQHLRPRLVNQESAKALINSRISGSFISVSEEENADESVAVPYILHPSWPGTFLFVESFRIIKLKNTKLSLSLSFKLYYLF